jgi:hypothetical protein
MNQGFLPFYILFIFQVNKMGGQIKVVQKEGPGTLMRLYLVFGTPSEISGQLSQHIQIEFDTQKLMVFSWITLPFILLSMDLRCQDVFCTFKVSL